MATKKAENVSLEKNISELEEIVKTLEKNDISLDDALKLFERGVVLSSQCTKILDEAEQKVSVMLKNDGEISEKDFLAGDEE